MELSTLLLWVSPGTKYPTSESTGLREPENPPNAVSLTQPTHSERPSRSQSKDSLELEPLLPIQGAPCSARSPRWVSLPGWACWISCTNTRLPPASSQQGCLRECLLAMCKNKLSLRPALTGGHVLRGGTGAGDRASGVPSPAGEQNMRPWRRNRGRAALHGRRERQPSVLALLSLNSPTAAIRHNHNDHGAAGPLPVNLRALAVHQPLCCPLPRDGESVSQAV